MAFQVKQLAVGGFDKNFSYLVWELISKHVAIVDPAGDVSKITRAIDVSGYTPTAVWLTHTHRDHLDGLPDIIKKYGKLPIFVHQKGIATVGDFANIHPVDDASEIPLGDYVAKTIYTPGHSDDSIAIHIDRVNAADGVAKLISGDTLFVGGCGRTTGQRVEILYESLLKLKSLPADTEVYPGHDYGPTPSSTIGWEVKHNKYYQTQSLEEFRKLRLSM